MPHLSQVLGCNRKLFAHLQSSKLYLSYFFSAKRESWDDTRKQTVQATWKPGILYTNSFDILTGMDCRTSICHYLSKGTWFWQQPFNCVEAGYDILLLNRKKPYRISRSSCHIFVKRKVIEIFLLQHFHWTPLQ